MSIPEGGGAPAPARASGRIPGADGLRGLAAVGVLALHVWKATDANLPAPPTAPDEVMGELRLGLVFFFVLSARLLAAPFVGAALDGRPRPSLRRFARHRVARIWPGYVLALVGAYLLLRGTGHPREGTLADLLASLGFLQNQLWWAAGRIDPPAWSLAVEVSFYVLLLGLGPLLGLLARRGGRPGALLVPLALVALGLAWCAVALHGAWRSTTTTSLPTYLPVFACGIAAAVLAHGRRPSRGAGAALVAAGAALVVLDARWHIPGTGDLGHVVLDLPAAAGFALVLLGLPGLGRTVLDASPLRFLGTVSFGVYLWHLPVVYWLEAHGHWPARFGPAFALVLAASLALATASWRLVEAPALALLARRGRAGTSPAPVGARPAPA